MTARELRQFRERLGLTQDQMAAKLGTTQATYAKWETGRRGRDYRLDPDAPIPDEIAERARKIRPASESRYQPTAEELRVRNCIERQVCPFCGRGGFRVLARHTQAAHGVNARALREMAALPMAASICAPDFARELREARGARMAELAPKAAAARAKTHRGSKVELTRGGIVGRAKANRRRAGLEAPHRDLSLDDR